MTQTSAPEGTAAPARRRHPALAWGALAASVAAAVVTVNAWGWFWTVTPVEALTGARTLAERQDQQIGDYTVSFRTAADMTERFAPPDGYSVLFVPSQTKYTGDAQSSAPEAHDADTPGLRCALTLRIGDGDQIRRFAEGLPGSLPPAPFTSTGACGLPAGRVQESLGYGFYLVPTAALEQGPLALELRLQAGSDGVDRAEQSTVWKKQLTEVVPDELPEDFAPLPRQAVPSPEVVDTGLED